MVFSSYAELKSGILQRKEKETNSKTESVYLCIKEDPDKK